MWVAFILERKEVLHDPNYCDFDKWSCEKKSSKNIFHFYPCYNIYLYRFKAFHFLCLFVEERKPETYCLSFFSGNQKPLTFFLLSRILWSLSVWAAPGVLLPHNRNAMRAYATEIMDMGKKYCTVNRLVLQGAENKRRDCQHEGTIIIQASKKGIFHHTITLKGIWQNVKKRDLYWNMGYRVSQ